MMLSLLLLTAAVAHAAPLAADRKLPVQGNHNYSSFHNAASAAAALQRFHASVGGPDAAAQHLDMLRSLVASQEIVLPELRHDDHADKGTHRNRSSIALPTIAEINKPIEKFLYAGDVMLTPADLQRMGAGLPGFADNIRNKRGAAFVTSPRWPKTQPIGYIFNNDISEASRKVFRTATEKIAANTCMSFKENGSGNQLQIHKGGGCWSYIGMAVPGKQPISIDDGCEVLAVVVHELSHALGIDHTQNRKDRDDYITINFDEVADENKYNFFKLTDVANNNFGIPYDYGSIMHYRGNWFSKSGRNVMVPKDKDYENTMGQRRHITFNDYKMINALYNCSASCPTQLACQNGGYVSSKNCNACVCNDFFTGTKCETPKALVSLTSSAKTVYHQDKNAALFGTNMNEFDAFGKEFKIIKAPEGKKIRVTINTVKDETYSCINTCPYLGVEFVDNAAGDLTTMGKLYCCVEDENISFVSKSNVIGYKAYAAPGFEFDVTVSYAVV